MGILPLLKKAALHLLFPQTCCHCREDLPMGRACALCRGCRTRVRPAEPPFCLRCGDRVSRGAELCRECARRPASAMRIRPAFFYGGQVASLVHAFKFRGRRDAARTAGRWLAAALARHPELGPFDCLAPVPLHPGRLRERGYNQALLLALEAGAVWNRPVEELLVRRRDTRPQLALRKAERRTNLLDGFGVVSGSAAAGTVAGRRVLLIDDVCTTGATLEECAKALRLAGAATVNALVFARQTA